MTISQHFIRNSWKLLMKTNDFPRVGDFTPECTTLWPQRQRGQQGGLQRFSLFLITLKTILGEDDHKKQPPCDLYDDLINKLFRYYVCNYQLTDWIVRLRVLKKYSFTVAGRNSAPDFGIFVLSDQLKERKGKRQEERRKEWKKAGEKNENNKRKKEWNHGNIYRCCGQTLNL